MRVRFAGRDIDVLARHPWPLVAVGWWPRRSFRAFRWLLVGPVEVRLWNPIPWPRHGEDA